MDQFTEVTSQSWLSRIGGSIKGVLFGLVLFLGSFVLLWWNEGRAVKTAKGLEEGAAQVVSVNPNDVDDKNNGKLVHLTGKAETEEVLKDNVFNVSENAIKLKRVVEMYQWNETSESKKEKKVGGGEETKTTYTYNKVWSTSLNNSDDFKVKEGHENPSQFRYEGKESVAGNVKVGAFKLSSSLIGQIDSYQAMPVLQVDTAIKNARLDNELVYIGADPANPQVGDLKVSFLVVKPTDVSIVSKQYNGSFEPYITQTETSLDMLSMGTVSADLMFAEAHSSNNITTWILRVVGFFVMFFGIFSIIKPVAVLADVLPFLGNLVEMGIGLVAGIISFALSFGTIAVAWVFYRPLLGISLLVLSGVAIFFLIKKFGNKKKVEEASVKEIEPVA